MMLPTSNYLINMEIITRKEAIAKSLKFYFTNKPCKHGHISKRYTSAGRCSTCMSVDIQQNKEQKAIYDRNRRIENGAEIRKYDKMRYMRDRDKRLLLSKRRDKVKLKEYKEKYYQNNKEIISSYNSDYYVSNTEKIKQKVKEYRNRNKEVCHQRAVIWRTNNKEKVSGYYAKRRAAKRQAVVSWYNTEKIMIESLYKIRDQLTKEIGIQHHVDHIVPLQHDLVCGLHCMDNLQVLTEAENLSKNNYFEVIVENG